MDWKTASADGLKDMDEKDYTEYRKIVHDWGGFDQGLVGSCIEGPAFDFKINKMRRLVEYQIKHGIAQNIIGREENLKDWGVLRSFYGASMKPEDEKKYMQFDYAFYY